ncbi:MAG: HD domain-containing protein, partial [Clostridium sp.]|nr:HD domain-containing protein [Clostridium sp.]
MIEYIRTENLKPGDTLAKALYDENGRILLAVGKTVTETAIRVIRQYGYKGVYIENVGEFRREDIPIPTPLVDDLTQLQLIAVLRNMYENKAIQHDFFDARFMVDKKKLHELLEEIVDTLCKAETEGRLLFELEDSRNMTTWLYFHSLNVCLLSIGMAIKKGLSKVEIMDIALGAIYHDMGKSWFEDKIVNKRGLTEAERTLLRQHPEKMFRFLQKHNYSVATLYSVWQHHEKINGEGYPSKIKGDKIVDAAKIVSCANSYDNLINMNPYAGSLSMYQAEAIEYLSANLEQDLESLRILFKVVAPYPVGTKVRLSNGT